MKIRSGTAGAKRDLLSEVCTATKIRPRLLLHQVAMTVSLV